MNASRLYEFAFRGILATEAVEQFRTRRSNMESISPEDIASRLGMDLLNETALAEARLMAPVYAAMAAFENSVRKLISSVLLEAKGEDWWNLSVSEKIRNHAQSRFSEEERIKWHGARGSQMVDFTDMSQLANIIQQNWEHFEPYLRSISWVQGILTPIERSRNVIMHSGSLDLEDIERIGINIRDWVKQVGS